MEVPAHLRSTVEMLKAAFPQGIPDEDVLPVMKALYEHMSNRNLADAVSHVTGEDRHAILNEVYKAASLDPSDPRVLAMVKRLKEYGYDDWAVE